MKKHVMSITYEPKRGAVFNGKCHQTIRHKSVDVGDEILFHEWTGKPYRSKWGRRLRVKVTQVVPIWISEEGISIIQTCKTPGKPQGWDHWKSDKLAEMDNIYPATGVELYNVLTKLNNGKVKLPSLFHIIRWEVMK